MKEIFDILKRELKNVSKDSSLFLILLLAPILYAFMYGSIYLNKGEEKVKHITEKGKEAGIQEEERYGKYGRKYYALVHTRESQEMILGELREYLADLTDE